ncbi:CYTH domain-containing protein [Candidatus Saccharibacteria bacterium]|nr:CYTH domain-containing protein [Candidatus Saccharibacteria bacterium]
MIEIEKKFLLTPQQQESLLKGSVESGVKLVTDSYLDTSDFSLTKNDLWFRERDGVFELKMPLKSGSGVATNRYHELTDEAAIARELGLGEVAHLNEALSEAGIKKFMTCYTQRTSYEKQGFHIDVDTVTYRDSSFAYAVAEIELLVETEEEADAAEARIITFAKQFDLIIDQVVLGKVAAFLKADDPRHYNALVAAGILSA